MSKPILRLILLAVLLALGAWFWKSSQPAQVSGSLQIDSQALPEQQHSLGAFVLHWTPAAGGELWISPQHDPQRRSWGSLPGRSFVSAARGQETVKEQRASFKISDRRQVVCADQALEEIDARPEAITLRGALSCRGGEPVGYTLTFSLSAPQDLAFELRLAEPSFNRVFLTYASAPDEHFFGFGEQFSTFDMKGRRLPIFVMEQGVGRGAQPITLGADLTAGSGGSWHSTYAGAPHYLTSQLRSLWLENYEYSVFDLRKPDRVQVEVFAPELRGHILHGDSPAELIESYTAAVGRMPILPEWILSGAVVGMQGGTDRVRQVYAQLQELDTPVAAFWLQDWVGQRVTSFGKQLWWNWELDAERYPGWDALVQDLSRDGVRVMTYASPFLADVSEKPQVGRKLFQEAAERGYLVKDSTGQPYLVQITSFSAGLVDLTNPEAVDWYKQVLQDNLIGVGASGWMADFGEALPYDAVLASGEPAASVHNQYPELWAQLNREAIAEAGLEGEAVFFTRSAFTRSPGYTTLMWAGDQLVSWDAHDGIKTAVTALLSSGISGFSFNHSDIGGYTSVKNPIRNYFREKELLLRWMELNAFTTVFRTHEGNLPDQNVQFYSDDETLAQFSRLAKVYAAWGFYRQALVEEAARTGLPVVRHPFIHYAEDPEVWELSYQEFMVGSELLAAPVLDPGRDEVRVYLPAGEWVLVWDGTAYSGGWVTVPAPIGQPAVFYRQGSEVGAQFVANLRAQGLLP